MAFPVLYNIHHSYINIEQRIINSMRTTWINNTIGIININGDDYNCHETVNIAVDEKNNMIILDPTFNRTIINDDGYMYEEYASYKLLTRNGMRYIMRFFDGIISIIEIN